MSAYGVKEARIDRTRQSRVNLCGTCGAEIGETELLCVPCLDEVPEANVESEGEEARRTR